MSAISPSIDLDAQLSLIKCAPRMSFSGVLASDDLAPRDQFLDEGIYPSFDFTTSRDTLAFADRP